MDDMFAMEYEYLIRTIYQVGRYGVDAADADIFRELETAYVLYTSEKSLADKGEPSQWNKSIKQLYSEYNHNASIVSKNIVRAIRKVQNDFGDKLSSIQYDKIEQCKILLQNPTIENIRVTITDVQDIVASIGLHPE